MLARIYKAFMPYKPPSAVIIFGDYPITISFHCVPEDGFTESLLLSGQATYFCHGGALAQASQRLGTIRVVDENWTLDFVDDVLSPRVRQLWAEAFGKESARAPRVAYKRSDSVDVERLIDEVLRPAALEAIRASEGQDPLEGEATRSLPVYIVRVSRSNYGRILEHNKFTSFPH